MEKEKLTLKLSATPPEFIFSLRKHFVIKMMVINYGDTESDPGLHLTRLMVNDKEPSAWMEAVGNGHRESNWFSLPAGKSVSISWSTLGDQLFQAPGEYILQLHLRNIKSEQVKIKVLKD